MLRYTLCFAYPQSLTVQYCQRCYAGNRNQRYSLIGDTADFAFVSQAAAPQQQQAIIIIAYYHTKSKLSAVFFMFRVFFRRALDHWRPALPAYSILSHKNQAESSILYISVFLPESFKSLETGTAGGIQINGCGRCPQGKQHISEGAGEKRKYFETGVRRGKLRCGCTVI